MTRFSRLVRMCGWHQPRPILLGVSEPTKPGETGETTGMCEECLKRFLAESHKGTSL